MKHYFALCHPLKADPDIEEFKTFLNQFRDHLNSLQPPHHHQCIGGLILDVARRPGPVQSALPRWEDGTIGHISLALLSRTRDRKRSRGGNVGRRRSRELCASPLDRKHEARLVPKSRRGLASVWTSEFESMADVETNADGLFVQRSLARRRVWRARDVSHLFTRDASARENPLWACVSRKMFETGPDHESDVPLVQTIIHRVNKMDPKYREIMYASDPVPKRKRSLPTDEGKSSRRHTSPDARPRIPDLKRPGHIIPDLKRPDHAIPDLKRPNRTIPDLKRPDHVISDLKRPDRTIPDLKRPDHGISKSTLVVSPILGDVSFFSSWEEPRARIFFHHHGIAIFSSSDDGFTLTNGDVSYALDQWCAKTLAKCLTYINIGTVCVTDN
ncbi:hypothetical protein NPIL_657691 [Nephila pilipes]|uniref:Uncharacterized protein n=1 Tax=Nephila pilipes TaxID=299642 RepID=A0A8X6NU98_NEPPI|nr:hypothetical protein NPIL_657691 [Nephila pilipes]